ncbi:hypothetical protein MTR_6g091840 [Medicago truncatula]|uniref:Uncharacterized protein n=1 Tax=Medicago truncatula TaxID=3880 RepID=G7KJ85_MEDTR|nr:hypothetical protein MTR_6g091840 [Medicago truncatula]
MNLLLKFSSEVLFACYRTRTPGEPFVAKSSNEAEMEKLVKSMENFGAENEDDNEDEDEDEDEADFPSKLGKVLRSKENEKGDWKQKIRKGIVECGHKHGWWKGKKAISSKKNPKPEL